MMNTATKRNTLYRLTAVAAALLVALSACTHEVGLFASLEQEIPVDEDRGFPTNGSIHALVFHEDGSTGRYFAGGSSLWVRTAEDASEANLQNWSRISPPTSASRQTLDSMALVDGEIYAVYDGNVYARPADGETAAGGWTRIDGDGDALVAADVLRVFAVEVDGVGETFVVSATRPDETVGSRLLNSDGTEVDGLGAADNRGTIYAVENFDGNIYVLTTAQLFRGGDTNLLTGMTAVTVPGSTSSTFRDMQVRGNDDELWIAGKGRLYVGSGDLTVSTNWTRTDETTPEDSSTAVQFTSIGFLTIGSTEYVLAGTMSNGLFEGEADEFQSITPEGSGRVLIGRSGNYLTTQIAGRAVARIVVDQNGSARGLAGPLVFLGAPGRGLWRGQPENGDFIWRRE
ncbi:MAG: hypothetical protein EA383_09160 [Spirochaetaceae bacterium]|nr:MAG: hypothetical protein EA383_09160 [Spirochaetaceae bacterium]